MRATTWGWLKKKMCWSGNCEEIASSIKPLKRCVVQPRQTNHILFIKTPLNILLLCEKSLRLKIKCKQETTGLSAVPVAVLKSFVMANF